MGDPLSGYRPPRIRLFEGELKLDPSIAQTMLTLKSAGGPAPVDWLHPNFDLLLPHWGVLLGQGSGPPFLAAPWQPASGPGWQPIPAPKPLVKPGAGPETPRPGEISDLVKALYAVPAIQGLVQQARDHGMRRLEDVKDTWQGASGGQRVLMISVTGLVAAGLVTPIVAYDKPRAIAFGLIKDKEIPVPGVDGLSFKILDRGAELTVPLGVTGLSASGHYSAPDGKPTDYGAVVNFDVAAFLNRKK